MGRCGVIITNAVPPCWVTFGRAEKNTQPQVREVCHRWERHNHLIPRIYEPFSRGGNSSHEEKGTLLSLRATKKISKSTERTIRRGHRRTAETGPRQPPRPTPSSAWLLASERLQETVLFPNTNYFLPPTTCSLGASLSLPDNLKAEPQLVRGRAPWLSLRFAFTPNPSSALTWKGYTS